MKREKQNYHQMDVQISLLFIKIFKVWYHVRSWV